MKAFNTTDAPLAALDLASSLFEDFNQHVVITERRKLTSTPRRETNQNLREMLTQWLPLII